MFKYFFRKSKSSEDLKKIANEISTKITEAKETKEANLIKKESSLEKTYDTNKLRIKIPK